MTCRGGDLDDLLVARRLVTKSVHDFDNAVIIQYLLAFYTLLSPGGTCFTISTPRKGSLPFAG